MSTAIAQNIQKPSTYARDPDCPLTPIPSVVPEPPVDILDVDLPCVDADIGPVPEDNKSYTESDKHDVHLQTRRDSSTNSEQAYSFDKMAAEPDFKEPIGVCLDCPEMQHIPCIKIESRDDASRNPITGLGLNGDGVGGLKPKKLKLREGNPVTGEGYKPGATDYIQHTPVGGTPVINKNRVPPGGYSSGLW
ncbi:microtubule-associated protein Jupiter isoform X4 [Drosophila busckii]|uniref:microtubule-associated protein Jupiter isoform X4 n=1 Tax=Drosophila busckii TaxID=30019 RepID=UPI00083EB720|nr:microtubule-associated protein Jupiter isoform X4 [Drosophila busckii]